MKYVSPSKISRKISRQLVCVLGYRACEGRRLGHKAQEQFIINMHIRQHHDSCLETSKRESNNEKDSRLKCTKLNFKAARKKRVVTKLAHTIQCLKMYSKKNAVFNFSVILHDFFQWNT